MGQRRSAQERERERWIAELEQLIRDQQSRDGAPGDWLASLLSKAPEPPTAEEIRLVTHYGIQKVRRALRRGVREGAVRVVIVERKDLMGRRQRVPGYRLQEEETP